MNSFCGSRCKATRARFGPALASAGAGLVVPLVAPKSRIAELPDDVAHELKRLNVTVRSKRDEVFCLVCVLLLLSSLAVWEWCMILAEKKDLTLIFGFSRPLVIGLISYFVAVIAAEIKEAL
ncbi:hypothetical protein [Caballeronia sp. LjRoot31]|uniref:hypothetical protein n=1 Tax=Caballeronia sp. LjRoot31 TaxID=3342324 RepID=UPI003ED0CFB4